MNKKIYILSGLFIILIIIMGFSIRYIYFVKHVNISHFNLTAFRARFDSYDSQCMDHAIFSSRAYPNKIEIRRFVEERYMRVFRTNFNNKTVYTAKLKLDKYAKDKFPNLKFTKLGVKDKREHYIFSKNRLYIKYYTDVNRYKYIPIETRKKYIIEKDKLIGLNEIFLQNFSTNKIDCNKLNLDKVSKLYCKRKKEGK